VLDYIMLQMDILYTSLMMCCWLLIIGGLGLIGVWVAGWIRG
jgi:hypothetical protein